MTTSRALPPPAAASAGDSAAREHPFPVGRDEEWGVLCSALRAAAAGERRVVLVAGGAGVGKSRLVDELRSFASRQGARCVACRFKVHQERETGALVEALRALGRLLLAEAGSEEGAQIRSRILLTLGAHAGLARVVPEFAALLGDFPLPTAMDPSHAAARMVEVTAALLRAVASAARPLVLVLDDLQWSGTLSTRLIDAVLDTPGVAGLLLVGAYRGDELPASHPLSDALPRWAAEASGFDLLSLRTLRIPEIAQLLSASVELAAADALELARLLEPCGNGNAYETLELVRALCDEGLLAPGPDGTQWNEVSVRDYLACTNVEDVMRARIARLSHSARHVLHALACLGTPAAAATAEVAAALPRMGFERAVDELRTRGLVARPLPEDGALQFAHHRTEQAAYATFAEPERTAFHLQLARRLSARPDLARRAAEQYLFAAGERVGHHEARFAATLLVDAAAEARDLGNHVAAHRMLETALRFLDHAGTAGADHDAALARCEVDYHLALCNVGRLAEADAVHQRIEARQSTSAGAVDAACAQVGILLNRDRTGEAKALALRMLARLGVRAPDDFPGGMDVSRDFERLRQWVESFDLARECARAGRVPRNVPLIGRIFQRLVSVAVYRNELTLLAWIIFRSRELWEEHGPAASLVVNFSRAAIVTIAFDRDWRTGYVAARQALDLCEAQNWEPEASLTRFVFGINAVHWFEPVERALAESERAREGLLAAGDLRLASFAHRHVASCLLDSGTTLRRFEQEVELAYALSRRAANQQTMVACEASRKLVRELVDVSLGAYVDAQDPASGAGGRRADTASDARPSGWAVWAEEWWRAVACAIFGHAAGLRGHACRATDVDFMQFPAESLYQYACARWLAGLGAAWQPAAAGAARELQDAIEWIGQRAVDAPANFSHMHLHLVGERAWTQGDLEGASRAFDKAMDAAERAQRPWHLALLTERAGRLHVALGWTESGSCLLLDAQRRYASWGAARKAQLLVGETGTALHALPAPIAQLYASTPAPHLVEVLRASEILSSERSAQRLIARAEETLAALTGAASVKATLWSEESQAWVAPAGTLPASVLRYVEQSREPLLLSDALADDPYARDEYFRGSDRCSLMAVPVLRQGRMRGLLLLENRAVRGAFGLGALDGVIIVAGQLAVLLENAQLYDRLERKVLEQTEELQRTQARVVEEAHRGGRSQVATNVLHSVGNLLTSVNVSVHVLVERAHRSRAGRVGDIARLIDDHGSTLAEFFRPGAVGNLLPTYARELAAALEADNAELLEELTHICASVDHIRNVVAVQQSYARAAADAAP